MAGIFDHLNHVGTGETQKTLNPPLVAGMFALRLTGTYTAQQLITEINIELGSSGPINADAEDDLTDIFTYINGIANADSKKARLFGVYTLLSMYEQSRPSGGAWLTEAQLISALTAMGVVFN